ncbi:MAG: hypothetical protein ACRDF4_08870, partial [Rhabdochlamydiaceae bacterium]
MENQEKDLDTTAATKDKSFEDSEAIEQQQRLQINSQVSNNRNVAETAVGTNREHGIAAQPFNNTLLKARMQPRVGDSMGLTPRELERWYSLDLEEAVLGDQLLDAADGENIAEVQRIKTCLKRLQLVRSCLLMRMENWGSNAERFGRLNPSGGPVYARKTDPKQSPPLAKGPEQVIGQSEEISDEEEIERVSIEQLEKQSP